MPAQFVIGTRAELHNRKQALLARSEVHRCVLRLECARLEQSIGWMDWGLRLVRSLSPWLALAAPFAAYVLARKRSGLRGLWMKGWAAWRLVRRVWPFARTFFGARK